MPDHVESYTLPNWRLICWLTDVGPDVPADVRARLIAGFFTSTKSLVLGALGSITVGIAAVVRHPTSLFIALLAFDVAVLIGRVGLLMISRRDARRGRRTQTDALLTCGLLWAAVVGVGTSACVASCDPVLVFLAPTTMLGIICGIVTRNSGAPRLAIAQVILCEVLLNFATPFLGQPWLILSNVQSIFFVVAMMSTIKRLNQNYLAALIAHKDSDKRANHDTLTGALNRAGAMAALSRDLKHAIRQRKELAAFYLDLDGFKAVNDGFGHAAGDELLVQAAKRLAADLPETWSVGRLGGDEFVIIAPGCDAFQATTTGASVVTAVGLLFDLGTGVQATIGVSIGVALATPDTTAERLLAEADAALYQAKTEGKGRCVMASGRRASDRLAA